MTNFERFCATLAIQYEGLFATHPAYHVHRTRGTKPEFLALDVTRGLASGAADKSGAGVVATCKALSIPNTYKAIRAYLQEESRG